MWPGHRAAWLGHYGPRRDEWRDGPRRDERREEPRRGVWRDHDNELPVSGAVAVTSQLKALGLQRYAAAFDEHGYDSWSELLQMADPQLSKLAFIVGMKSDHLDRLRAALRREALGRAPSDGVAPAFGGFAALSAPSVLPAPLSADAAE